MFQLKSKYLICELFGIPITADISSLFLALWIVFEVGIPLGLPCVLILVISIVLHELAHSLTTKSFGHRINEIRLSLLGGCASGEIPRKAWQEFLMAAAGPAMSLSIGFSFLWLFVSISWNSDWLASVIANAAVLNIMLGTFNLLPGFPMDGGRIFRCIMRLFVTRAKATYYAMIVGRVAAVALVVLPLVGINRIWIIPVGGYVGIRLLIAWMIWREGYREYLMARQEEDFSRWTQEDFNARVSPPPYER